MRKILFVVLCCITCKCIAQKNVPSFLTPSVTSINKFIDVPVDKSSGVPEVNIPIYTLKEGTMELPINIVYHAGGIKVEEQASNVGLGWALNCGGVISRNVKGSRPDEHGYYIYKGAPPMPLIYQAGCSPICPYYVYLNELEGSADTEPDIFYFSFNGYSGRFFFDKNRNIVLAPQQDLKIEFDLNTAFKIITPDGNQYFFTVTNQSKSFFVDGYASDQITTGWNLSKIITADFKEINFSYEQEGESYQRTLAHEQNLVSKNSCPNISYVTNRSNVYGNRIVKITSPSATIDFNYKNSFREDYSSTSLYKAIDNIVVINNFDKKVIKNFDFKTSYFISTAPSYLPNIGSGAEPIEPYLLKRLRLDSLTEKSGEGAILPSYKFFYNKNNIVKGNLLPNRLSLGQDHWGYYNGLDSNSSLYPTLFALGDTSNILCVNKKVNREPSEDFSTAFILDEIQYPDGGTTKFLYESIKSGNQIIGGGLRIKEISSSSVNTTKKDLIRKYNYSNPVVVGGSPKYVLSISDGSFPLDIEHYDYPYCTYQDLKVSQVNWYMAFMDPVNLHGDLISNHVIHEKVIEFTEGNGSVESIYDVENIFQEVNSNSDNDNEYPTISGASTLLLKGGKLLKEISRDETGKILRSTEFEYAYQFSTNPYNMGSVYKVYKPFCLQRFKLSSYATGGVVLKEKRQTVFSDEALKSNTIYEYGGLPYYHYVTQEQSVNSAGEIITRIYKYAPDYMKDISNSSSSLSVPTKAIKMMNDKFLVNRPIETAVLKRIDTSDFVINASLAVPGFVSNQGKTIIVIDSVSSIKSSKPILYDLNFFSRLSKQNNLYELIYSPLYTADAKFNNDNSGLLNSMSERNGMIQSFLWGYNDLLPVLKAINAVNDKNNGGLTEVFYDGFEESKNEADDYPYAGKKYHSGAYSVSFKKPNSKDYFVDYHYYNNNKWAYKRMLFVDNMILSDGSAIDEVRVYPIDAQVSSYTYEPLIGMTSESDANGKTTYYEYDGFGRLSIVRDQDRNILKKYCYNYAGQKEECIKTYYNTEVSVSFQKNDCNTGLTGSSYTYTIPAGKYSSLISQADANLKATYDVNANGQLKANQEGVCIAPVVYVKISEENAVTDATDVKADIVIRFYADESCTVPVNVNNLQLGYGTQGNCIAGTAGVVTCHGNFLLLSPSALIQYDDIDPYDNSIKHCTINYYLIAGNGYIIK